MTSRFFRMLVVGAVAAFIGAGGVASPASAVPITSTEEFGVGCSGSGNWEYQISPVDYVGGTSPTPRPAPASIQAELEGGTWVTVALEGPPAWGVATYSLPGSTSPRPTGKATADVSYTPTGKDLFLRGGPCAETKATIKTNDPVQVEGGTITISGAITKVDGSPVAGHEAHINHFAPTGTPVKGGFDTTVVTDANGKFTKDYPATSVGQWVFALQFHGSGAFNDALQFAHADAVEVFVVPAAAPAGDGSLESSAGTGSHSTTLSGSGFDPESSVAIVVYSQPTYLTTVKADSAGMFSAKIDIPETLTGDHTIVALGQFEGLPRDLTLGVNLPAPAVLAQTGTTLTPIIATGSALVVLGALLWWIAARRRSVRRA